MTLVWVLLGTLAASGLVLASRWTIATQRAAAQGGTVVAPTLVDVLIGFVTNFFDTLGIGSFATTTTVFRLFRRVPDESIPGTIIVGDAMPVLAQALLFISTVSVDPSRRASSCSASSGWTRGRRSRS